MTRRRLLSLLLLVSLAAAALLYLRAPGAGPASPDARSGARPGASPDGPVPRAGGHLTGTMRAEPETFNRHVKGTFPTHLVSLLTGARLVRINPLSQEPEPWLARSFEVRPDGRAVTVTLRDGVRWSDGALLTPEDVAFSLRAAYEAKESVLGDALRIGGKPMEARIDSRRTVTFLLPSPYGPIARLLDTLPIVPRHVLEERLADGTFAQACGTGDPCPGLGPFIVSEYHPGQRIVFSSNAYYWRIDDGGRRLPYLDGLTLEIVPDQNAELLRLTSGQADVMQSEPRAEDVRALKEQAGARRVTLEAVGPALDRQMLWFNLGPKPIDPAKAFLREDAFREAVSRAVDRQGFADAVFLGAADPAPWPVTSSNRMWHAPDLPRPAYEPARAAALLEGLQLKDRDNDGLREDAAGRPVRFTVLVQTGITAAQRGAEFLRDALHNLGVGVDVVPLDLASIFARWGSGDYEAIYHYLQMSDTDPAGNLDFWLSSGNAHLWHPAQKAPATPWEAEIDRLMQAQVAAPDRAERVRLFTEAQRIIGERNPVIWFAAPRVFVAYNPRVGGVAPAITRPQVLWNADELFVTR